MQDLPSVLVSVPDAWVGFSISTSPNDSTPVRNRGRYFLTVQALSFKIYTPGIVEPQSHIF